MHKSSLFIQAFEGVIINKHVLILVVLLATMLAVGCTGSNSEKNTSSDQASSPLPAQVGYQDLAWKKSFENTTIGVDVSFQNIKTIEGNIQVSKENNDPSGVILYEGMLNDTKQQYVDYVEVAMAENNRYNVSPKYQEAQKEWGLALQDYYDGGKYYVFLIHENYESVKGKPYPDSSAPDSEKIKSLFTSGDNHKKRALDLAGSLL
jgi:hypothetical protein